jgi:phosphoribosylaminoimidazole (AIR) synthetase
MRATFAPALLSDRRVGGDLGHHGVNDFLVQDIGGIVDMAKVIDGRAIAPGDLLIGRPSTGS